MAGIFIGYRREDSAGYAGRLADALAARFGHDHVFRDLEDIRPGDDFVDRIESAVATADVLLIVIGPHWLSVTDEDGSPRLTQPHDFVRLEIATALRRGTRLIPVLVGSARMPEADELPHDIADLARRHAHELSDARWSYDIERLIETLVSAGVREARTARHPAPARRWATSPRTWAMLVVLTGAALFGVLNVVRWADSQPSAQAPPGPVPDTTRPATDPPSARDTTRVAVSQPAAADSPVRRRVEPVRVPLRPRRVLLYVEGAPPSAVAAARGGLSETLTRGEFEVLDGSQLSLGAGPEQKLRQLAAVARARGAATFVVAELDAAARPSVGNFFTGRASIRLAIHSTANDILAASETVQIGAAGVPGKLGPSEDAARDDAAASAGALAARAIARHLPPRAR